MKGGYLQADTKIGSSSKSDSGTSYGAGLGFGVGVLQLELEVAQTSLENKLTYVNLGIQF